MEKDKICFTKKTPKFGTETFHGKIKHRSPTYVDDTSYSRPPTLDNSPYKASRGQSRQFDSQKKNVASDLNTFHERRSRKPFRPTSFTKSRNSYRSLSNFLGKPEKNQNASRSISCHPSRLKPHEQGQGESMFQLGSWKCLSCTPWKPCPVCTSCRPASLITAYRRNPCDPLCDLGARNDHWSLRDSSSPHTHSRAYNTDIPPGRLRNACSPNISKKCTDPCFSGSHTDHCRTQKFYQPQNSCRSQNSFRSYEPSPPRCRTQSPPNIHTKSPLDSPPRTPPISPPSCRSNNYCNQWWPSSKSAENKNTGDTCKEECKDPSRSSSDASVCTDPDCRSWKPCLICKSKRQRARHDCSVYDKSVGNIAFDKTTSNCSSRRFCRTGVCQTENCCSPRPQLSRKPRGCSAGVCEIETCGSPRLLSRRSSRSCSIVDCCEPEKCCPPRPPCCDDSLCMYCQVEIKEKESHMCPWEADVTVTGTVRSHCTVTAEKVATQLAGTFKSCGKAPVKGSCDEANSCGSSSKAVRFSLGCLDDGNSLNFSRNNRPSHTQEELAAENNNHQNKTDYGNCSQSKLFSVDINPAGATDERVGKLPTEKENSTDTTYDSCWETENENTNRSYEWAKSEKYPIEYKFYRNKSEENKDVLNESNSQLKYSRRKMTKTLNKESNLDSFSKVKRHYNSSVSEYHPVLNGEQQYKTKHSNGNKANISLNEECHLESSMKSKLCSSLKDEKHYDMKDNVETRTPMALHDTSKCDNSTLKSNCHNDSSLSQYYSVMNSEKPQDSKSSKRSTLKHNSSSIGATKRNSSVIERNKTDVSMSDKHEHSPSFNDKHSLSSRKCVSALDYTNRISSEFDDKYEHNSYSLGDNINRQDDPRLNDLRKYCASLKAIGTYDSTVADKTKNDSLCSDRYKYTTDLNDTHKYDYNVHCQYDHKTAARYDSGRKTSHERRLSTRHPSSPSKSTEWTHFEGSRLKQSMKSLLSSTKSPIKGASLKSFKNGKLYNKKSH